uniref:Sorbitol dehydrogenase n=1 Tax=Macrostomum lignano TaxID=282301 RepID=A0A1I8HMA2_9PLAT
MTDSKNISVVLQSVNNIKLEERPIPRPGPRQVLLRMDSVGICGSDVHYWTHGAIGDFVVRQPMVLGHESAGVVTEVGAEVDSLRPGDRVAVEPGIPCRFCDLCKSGRYNLCPDVKFLATPPVDGSLSGWHVHDADFCFRLPDHVSLEEGALLEPLSVGVHARRRAGVTLGSRVLICGAGPIGLVNLLTAKAMGADTVILTDINPHRLTVAKEMGADATLIATGSLVSQVCALFNGRRPDIVIECTGAEASVGLSVRACRSGGCVVLVGLGKPEIVLPIVQASVREVDIRGVFRYANCYPDALSLVAQGRVNVKPLITHRFPLSKSVDAFETAKTGAGNAIKMSAEKNIAVVLRRANEIVLEERPIPRPGPRQVLLRMDSVGICGSDVHYWTHGAIGDFVVRQPMVLGHESAGVVTEVGAEVDSLRPGDRVAVEPGIPCRFCDLCKSGRYNLCPDVKFLATPPVDGSLSGWHVHDADFCFRLPDHVSLEEGALLEPLSVGVHACRRAGVTLGSRVLICGAGPIGLVNLLTAKAMGADTVILTDINPHRLTVAKEMGADGTLLVTESQSVESQVAAVNRLFGDRQPDAAIECTGSVDAVRLSLLSCKPGGCLITVGRGRVREMPLPLAQTAVVREVEIRGVFRYANCYADALSLVARGAVDVRRLITHRYPLDRSEEAFETSRTAAGNAIKVMIKCQDFA